MKWHSKLACFGELRRGSGCACFANEIENYRFPSNSLKAHPVLQKSTPNQHEHYTEYLAAINSPKSSALRWLFLQLQPLQTRLSQAATQHN